MSFTNNEVQIGGGSGATGEPAVSELTAAVSEVAGDYADTLEELLNAANGGSMNLATTTVLTTRVQQQQAILEMVQGVVKAATQQIKDLGKRIG